MSFRKPSPGPWDSPKYVPEPPPSPVPDEEVNRDLLREIYGVLATDTTLVNKNALNGHTRDILTVISSPEFFTNIDTMDPGMVNELINHIFSNAFLMKKIDKNKRLQIRKNTIVKSEYTGRAWDDLVGIAQGNIHVLYAIPELREQLQTILTRIINTRDRDEIIKFILHTNPRPSQGGRRKTKRFRRKRRQ